MIVLPATSLVVRTSSGLLLASRLEFKATAGHKVKTPVADLTLKEIFFPEMWLFAYDFVDVNEDTLCP
jgi:hypothetical protein